MKGIETSESLYLSTYKNRRASRGQKGLLLFVTPPKFVDVDIPDFHHVTTPIQPNSDAVTSSNTLLVPGFFPPLCSAILWIRYVGKRAEEDRLSVHA